MTTKITFDDRTPKVPAIEAPCFMRFKKSPGTVILATNINSIKGDFTGLVISLDRTGFGFSRVGAIEGGWDLDQFERIPGTATITLD